jgi:transcriptional repressor NrdR
MCTACKRRFTTYEKLGAPSLKVHKRDGSVEPFDGDKLFRALQRVAAHRDVADDVLMRIARDIEAKLLDAAHKSVAWSEIVQLALARLGNVDSVVERRLAANYADDTGAIKLDNSAPRVSSPQLGLPLTDDSE